MNVIGKLLVRLFSEVQKLILNLYIHSSAGGVESNFGLGRARN